MNESAPELQHVFARLRQARGPALAAGQTPCCYALSIGHPLLRGLGIILNAVARIRKAAESKETKR